MKLFAGRITIASAGTRIQWTSEADIDDNMVCIWAQFRGDPDNTNDVFVGIADVSASIGWSLEASDPFGIELPIRKIDKKGSIDPSTVWFDSTTSGEKVDYVAFFE